MAKELSIPVAVILAGGIGKRIAPWPAPKSLMPVNGIPIILRLIRHIEKSCDRIVICTGYRSKDIVAATQGNPKITYSDMGEKVGMLCRIIAATKADKIRFLVCYADECADVDLKKLLSFHIKSKASLTFTSYKQVIPFGVIVKNKIEENRSVFVNIGFVIIEPECFSFASPDQGLSDFINCVRNHRKVSNYVHKGKRATVNSLSDLDFAEKVWK